MAVALTGSGGLFTRFGHIGGGILDIDAIRGGAATARTLSGASMLTRCLTTLQSDYNASVAIPEVLNGITTSLASFQTTQNGFLSALRTLAGNTIIRMVDLDAPLSQKTLSAALAVLIQQMLGTSDSVKASVLSVGSQTAYGAVAPTGNPIIVVGTKGDNGVVLQYVLPETMRFTVTNDSYSGGATAGQESMAVAGTAQISDPLAYNWPGGSAANTTLTLINPGVDAQSSNNILVNSDFETFTSNTPNSWSVLVGTAGTDILAGGGGQSYTGSNCLEFLENSGTLSSVAQLFGQSVITAGTTISLQPETSYAVNCFMKKTSGLSGAGTITLSLLDGSNNVITDTAGNANTITQVLASLATSYGAVSGFFRTPAILPAVQKLAVRLTVAIADSGKAVYVDRLGMTPATSLYTGGPPCAAFSGSTPVLIGDAWTIAIGNTWGVVQKLFERLFGMRSLGLTLPNAGSPTIADSVVA